MRYYPAFLDLNGKSCCVVGGGPVAYRKVKTLIDCGARVMVVSPEVSASLQQWVRRKKIRWVRRGFKNQDVRNTFLVIAATNDRKVNRKIADLCHRRKIWVNVVDQPKAGSFIVPSSFRRGKLTIAVSTAGVSPALAKWIRVDLDKRYAKLGRRLN